MRGKGKSFCLARGDDGFLTFTKCANDENQVWQLQRDTDAAVVLRDNVGLLCTKDTMRKLLLVPCGEESV